MPNKFVPCKHLDYDEGRYSSCDIERCPPPNEHVRYWARSPVFSYGGRPRNVQFCGQGLGRINAIFDCYQAPGPMNCYEPGEPVE